MVATSQSRLTAEGLCEEVVLEGSRRGDKATDPGLRALPHPPPHLGVLREVLVADLQVPARLQPHDEDVARPGCTGSRRSRASRRVAPQVAVFDLDTQAVEIKLMESIVLSNGDQVIVAGDTRRGLFRGLAYRNQTRRVDGKGPIAIYLFVGIVFCAIVVFLPVGLWLIARARKYDEAFKAVTAQG